MFKRNDKDEGTKQARIRKEARRLKEIGVVLEPIKPKPIVVEAVEEVKKEKPYKKFVEYINKPIKKAKKKGVKKNGKRY